MMSINDFELHKCDLSIVAVRNIPVVYFMDESCKGRKFMTGWGTDGVLYTFEVVPRKLIPVAMTTDEFLQRKKSDKDFTEPLCRLC